MDDMLGYGVDVDMCGFTCQGDAHVYFWWGDGDQTDPRDDLPCMCGKVTYKEDKIKGVS